MQMQADAYKTVCQEGSAEIIIKKSRFIAHVYPVSEEQDALLIIEELKKKYWDAKHNCYAYIIGRNSFVKCSDDGEPSGTAGKPMLEVLQKEELQNVLVVVTRYFGGVLLGTGGLVRAYSQTAKEGLLQAKICTMQHMTMLELKTDYTYAGKIKYCLSEEKIQIIQEEYTDSVMLTAAVCTDEIERVEKKLIDSCSGRINMEETGQVFMAKTD